MTRDKQQTIGSLSPIAIYQSAVNDYNEKDYRLCILKLNYALPLFDNDSAGLASCYSTIASSYRELQFFETAIKYCLDASRILIKLEKTEKLNPVITKLKGCIDHFNLTPHTQETLYSLAIDCYKKEEYKLALIVLEHIQPKYQDGKLAICLSTIASCYLELEDLHTAQTKCEEALLLATQTCGETHSDTTKIAKILSDIVATMPNLPGLK